MSQEEQATWRHKASQVADGVSVALEYANQWIDPILKVLIGIALAIILLSAVSLLSIAWHQLTFAGSNIYIPSTLKSLSEYILEFFEKTPPYSDPDEINKRLSIIVGVLGAFATSFFTIAAAASTWYLKRRLKSTATVQTQRIFVEGKGDIRIMIKEYLKGSRVVVFGGNFSWIGSPIAKATILKLVESDKIEFISYKGTSAIESEIGSELFKKIESKVSIEGTIKGLKASLIYDNSGELQSYLYQTKSADDKDIFVCKIQGTNPDGRRLLQQILKFAKNYPLTKLSTRTPKIILVCGKSKTGKSAFCRSMNEQWGYPTVSAGSLLREMYKEEFNENPTPIQLLDFGKKALIPGSRQGAILKERLLRKIELSERTIIIDGLRVPWLFYDLMQHYGTKAHLLIFTASDSDRETRLKKEYNEAFNEELKKGLEELDGGVDLIESLAIPQYHGQGAEFAFTTFAATRYPCLRVVN